MLQAQRDRIVGEATRLYSDVRADAEVRVRQRSDLATMIEGELRCLLGIVHVVIRDMTQKPQAAWSDYDDGSGILEADDTVLFALFLGGPAPDLRLHATAARTSP